MRRLVPFIFSIGLFSAASSALADGVAKFRVVDVKLKGTEATVEVAWDYSSGGQANYQNKGSGVQFYVQPGGAPGYSKGKKDFPVGTVDMTEGSGMATFKVDTAKLNAKPGDQLTMWAVWPDTSHQWGVDKDRPGGEFTLPAQNSLLRHARRPLWLSAAAALHGARVPASRGPTLQVQRAQPWLRGASQNSRFGVAHRPWTIRKPASAMRAFFGGRR